ncbi:hypothetical protein TcWFU_006868 [Taenia crassiceps]|uniref:Uncharacterized protein n=1 Tax=Taenia crassiceps TaxID=6207 RepID=A0ABR4QHV1_9CEST
MEDKPVNLGTMVELFLTWLLDYKPYVLNICSLNDIAFMFCEERGLKLTKGLLTQFHISAIRFFDKVERVKGVSQVRTLSTTKRETATQNGVHIGQCCHSGEELTSIGDAESVDAPPSDIAVNENPSLSPPLITTPISNSRRKATPDGGNITELFPGSIDGLP